MKNWSINIILTAIVLTISTSSCLPPSSIKVKEIQSPETNYIENFNLKFDGEILYQFYQKYGFTDLEEQLILIVKPNSTDLLINELPFNTMEFNRLERIQTNYFFNQAFLNLKVKKDAFMDIRIESKEYNPIDTIKFDASKGKYLILTTDSVETLYVWDSNNNYLYIESNKKHNN